MASAFCKVVVLELNCCLTMACCSIYLGLNMVQTWFKHGRNLFEQTLASVLMGCCSSPRAICQGEVGLKSMKFVQTLLTTIK